MRVFLIASRPRSIVAFFVPFLHPFSRTNRSVQSRHRSALFFSLFSRALVILVVSRVAMLRLILLREPRVERRSFNHNIFRRCFFLLFWLFLCCYLFFFYLFLFVLFLNSIIYQRERESLKNRVSKISIAFFSPFWRKEALSSSSSCFRPKSRFLLSLRGGERGFVSLFLFSTLQQKKETTPFYSSWTKKCCDDVFA